MVSCLEKLDSENDDKANGFLHCILEFHFLVTLVLVTGVLLVTTVLSTKLQYKTIDLNDAATYSKAAVRQLQGWVNEVSNDVAVDDQEEEEKQQHNPHHNLITCIKKLVDFLQFFKYKKPGHVKCAEKWLTKPDIRG